MKRESNLKATKKSAKKTAPKAQKQKDQPGDEYKMNPQPDSAPDDPRIGRLEGKIAVISGGDSGIGRAVALAFVAEGASVVLAYYDEKRTLGRRKSLLKRPAENVCLYQPMFRK